MPYLSDSTTTNSYNYTKELVINEPPIRNFDWEKARLEFKLLDDFLSMNIKIYHSELLGLYSGMRRIEGGAKNGRKLFKIINQLMREKNISQIGLILTILKEPIFLNRRYQIMQQMILLH